MAMTAYDYILTVSFFLGGRRTIRARRELIKSEPSFTLLMAIFTASSFKVVKTFSFLEINR